MSDALLELRDLRVRFRARGGGPPVRAVDGVDLAVRRGEIVALAGESGCGKTTLARTVLGLERPAGGEVCVDGAPLGYGRRELRAWRRRVQLVPQDPTGSLNPRRTVYDAVAEGLQVHRLTGSEGDERARVTAALERAGLTPADRFARRHPHELSGGQRQRVLIAGALALEPELLVADEPVSSLDASVRGTILALLQRLRGELGLTVLVVTHDLGLAWTIADRIAVMYLGRIVEVGPVEQVLTAPSHPYTQALLSVVPSTSTSPPAPASPPRLQPVLLPGETPDPSRIPGGCRFRPRCPAYADGRAEAAGVADRCRGTSPAVIPADAVHAAACWLAEPAGELTREPVNRS